MSTLDDNKAIARRLLDQAINERRLAVFDELLSSDFVEHEPVPVQGTGREAPKQLFAMLHEAFPGLHWTVADVIAEGDRVVVYGVMTGTNKGSFMGIPATGKSVKMDVIDIMRIANGKIAEHWGVSDMMTLMQQLGLAAAPGAPGGR